MSFLSRRRLVVVGLVAAFVAVFAAVGALSRSSPTGVTTAVASPPGTGTAPDAAWYWTIAVAPSAADTLVLGTAGGLYRSIDGGKSWRPTGPKGFNATSVVEDGALLFAGGGRSRADTSPVVRQGAGRVAATGALVLGESHDGGASWTLLHPRGLPNAAVQALAVDPVGAHPLFLLLNTGGLYRSNDDARSFQLVTARLGVTPWALAITGGGLVAGDMDAGSHVNAGFVAGDMDAGSHLSTNGTSWQATGFTDADGGKMVMEYAVEPGDPSHLLMSSYGVEASSDGGKTWHPALSSTVMFGPVAFATGSAHVAYAVGFDGSVWRSANDGASWSKIS